MDPQNLGRGANKFSIEEKAAIISYKKAGMKTKEIIAHTGRNTTTITCILAASRALPDQSIPQRKKGSGRPRKVTEIVLKSLKRQIKKYSAMTAGQLKARVLEVAALSDRSIQRTLQKGLKMPSSVAAMKPLITNKMTKKRMAFYKKYKNWSAADWEKVIQMDPRSGSSEPQGVWGGGLLVQTVTAACSL
jgi:transposase